ncbi:hypothetical protein [Chryseobacterium defluvii]|uniref:Uncharacterized protein n=1 Tax=Chryseobacterium defluvii TaxID=160396 RepID=A0A495SAX5_9FLAO|nr:hypothetical protein [Chryseobacterium defluvii]RKS97410.1 hypothetical protein BCF58_1532 [Chryseobacterium defluvii]
MKTKVIIILFSLFSIISYGQAKDNTSLAEIKKTLTLFAKSLQTKNINNTVELIHPKYFTITPKDKMLQMLNFTYDNPYLKTNVQRFIIHSVEKPEKIGNEYFAVTDYSFKMNLKIDWAQLPVAEEMKKQIRQSITKQFGDENVQHVQKGDYYIINTKMKACAISGDNKNWKLIILEKNQKPQLMKILPKKIVDKV